MAQTKIHSSENGQDKVWTEKATIVVGEKKSRYFMLGAVLWYITVLLHFIMYFAS